jgi:hypothetical protein
MTPPDVDNQTEELHKRMDRYHERLIEVEDIVLQLNEDSTQPAIAPTKEIEGLKKNIVAVEKQLHAALGAKHKAGLNGEKDETCRLPTVH